MKSKLIFKIFLSLLILLNILDYSSQEVNSCPKDSPIKYNNNCVTRFCNKSEYDNNICSINNEQIKIQWLNDIIRVSNSVSYKYVNPIYKDNILIIFSFPYDEDQSNIIYSKRKTYALNKDGRPYFYSKENKYFSSSITWTLNQIPRIKFFSPFAFLKSKKEKYSNISENFLLIVSASNKYTEAYNFLEDYLQLKVWMNNTETDNFEKYNNYNNYYKKSYIETSENGNEVLAVFNGAQGGINKLIFVGYSFELNNGLLLRKSYVYQHISPVSNTRMCSCLRTLNKIFGCFYINADKNFTFTFIEFTYGIINQTNPKFLKSFNIEENYRLKKLNLFYKCFHLKNEIGIFIYLVDYNNLFIQIKELKTKSNNEFEMDTILKININKYNFNSVFEYCDSIRVNDNRFFFASATNDSSNLVLLLFDIFNNDQSILIRY